MKNDKTKPEEVKQDECDCGCNYEEHETEACKCEEKTAEIESWKNKYLRTLADYQNLENRIAKQFEEYKIRANKNLILDFLEILDMLDNAEVFIKDEGLKMIKTSFENKLKNVGVKEIEVLNKKFDPNNAECIEVIDGKNDDVVVKVAKRGFEINKEILRVAQVSVEKKQITN